ncbi:MAG TPA: ABC transporter substrate-binding protein [Coriobacteriia bacterium]
MRDRLRTPIALLVVLSLAVGLAIAGCTTSTTTEGTKPPAKEVVKGGTLNFYIGEPAYIDPYNASESEGAIVIASVFDSLVDFDPLTSKIKPAVAEKWSSPDGVVWTFNLRKGTKFHNGREVKAADFKYAWERICDPAMKSDISYHLAPIKGFDEMQAGTAKELTGVVAKDDNTLEVTLQYPFADFEYVAGHPALGPVPKEEVEKDPKAFLEKPIGNGPFMLTEPWSHQQFIKTVAFKDYYGAKPNIDGVTFKIFKDDTTAFTDFQQGNLDFTAIPTGQIKPTVAQYGESPDGYTMNPGKQVILGSELSTYYVWINCKDAVTKNAKLRKAISLAINRQAICDVVYEGTRIPGTGPVPAGIVGYQKDAWPYNKYDVEAAKKMLADAGFPGGAGLPEISLAFNAGRGHEKVMQLIQADLAVIGVKVKLAGQPWETYVSDWLKAKDGQFINKDVHQLMRLGWLADYPIMDNFLYPMFDSKSGDNKSLYENADVDRMLKEARSEVDGEKRIKLYQEIEKKIGEDQPLISVVNYRHLRVSSDRVNDLVFSPIGLPDFTNTWLKAAAAK